MTEYIDKSELYKEIAELEELSRRRVVDTPTNSPAHTRYVAQLNERTMLKHKIADTHAADVAPVVHSYWEHIISSDEENIGVCHNCKYPVSWFWGIAKYYPNCGAKMDKGDEDDV